MNMTILKKKSFSERQANIFSNFTKQKDELITLNTEIDTDIQSKNEQVQELQKNIEEGTALKTRNQKIISNINKLLDIDE